MKKAIAELKSIIVALNASGIEKWVEKFAKSMNIKVVDFVYDVDRFAIRLGTTDNEEAYNFGQSLLGVSKKFGFKDLDIKDGSRFTDLWFKIK